MICGGGDNYMSVLADSAVESVTCVDMSPFQLALGQLKLAVACSNLTTEEALGFLGMNDTVDRVQVYEKDVEPHLSLETSGLIRQHLMHEITTGIVHFGPGENAYRYLSNTLDDMGFDRQSCGTEQSILRHSSRHVGMVLGHHKEFIDASLIAESLPKEAASLYTDVMEKFFFPMICMGQYRIVANGDCRNHITAMQILNRYDQGLTSRMAASTHSKCPTREAVTCNLCSIHHFSRCLLWNLIWLVHPTSLTGWPVKQPREHLDEIAAKFLAPHGYVLVRMGIRSLASVLQATKLLRVCNDVRPEDLAETDKVQVFFQRPEAFAALRHSSVEV